MGPVSLARHARHFLAGTWWAARPLSWKRKLMCYLPVWADQTTIVCRVCMLSCWPGDLQSSRESVSTQRKQLWLAIAANEFLLGGKHWLHLWAPKSLGKAQATQRFLRNFTFELRICARSCQREDKRSASYRQGTSQVVASSYLPPTPPAGQCLNQLLICFKGIPGTEGSCDLIEALSMLEPGGDGRGLWPSPLLLQRKKSRTREVPRSRSSLTVQLKCFLVRNFKGQLWWYDG